MKPIVAIVGRPNVGKSTLFNKIIGKKIAIVEDIPGLTRDRIYGEAEWSDRPFIVIDTGGFQPEPEGDIIEEVKKQAVAAVEEADIVLMMMDAKEGLMPSDAELSGMLRTYNKKILYVVNKIDGPRMEKAVYDFYSLGKDLFPVSAVSGFGFEELMDSIAEAMPEGGKEEQVEYPRIAIIGRPNVGKSTFTNSLLGKQRMIVSPVPGTTRDSVDSICSHYRKKYLIVDTAGIRRKGKMAKSFERYSFIRTLRNIEICDIALILFDAKDGIVELDQKIAGLVYEAGKAGIVLFNKWDLVDRTPAFQKKLENEFQNKLWFMNYTPVLTVSALQRQRVTKIFPLIDEVVKESSKKISTKELNSFLRESVSIKQPDRHRGREVKLNYMTQVGIKPPRFVIFTNKKEAIKPFYIRFLGRRLREKFGFKGVPVRLFIRQKTR